MTQEEHKKMHSYVKKYAALKGISEKEAMTHMVVRNYREYLMEERHGEGREDHPDKNTRFRNHVARDGTGTCH